VSEPSLSSPSRRPGGLWVAVAWLTAALLAVYPLFGWWGYHRHGALGLVAAGFAASVCWVAGASALACVRLTTDTNPVAGVLGSMVFRMGLPLASGLVLQQTHEPLASVNIFGTVLLYYLITLAVETILSVRMVGVRGPVSRAA